MSSLKNRVQWLPASTQAPPRRDVVILVDVSNSMLEVSPQNPQPLIHRAMELAGRIAGEHASAEPRLAVFAEEVESLPAQPGQDPGAMAQGILPWAGRGPGGGTHLYDCAAQAAREQHARCQQTGEQATLYVITDGQDCGSREMRSWDQLNDLMSQLDVKLVVLDVARPGTSGLPQGQVGSHIEVTDDTPVSLPCTPPVIHMSLTPSPQPYEGLSCPLLCLDPAVPGDVLAAIARQFAFVVRYLEELSGLRYYPAPTVIVDESTYATLVEEGPEPPPELHAEALAMLNALCQLYHHGKSLLMSVEAVADLGAWKSIRFPENVKKWAECLAGDAGEFLETGVWRPGGMDYGGHTDPREFTRFNIDAVRTILAGWRARASATDGKRMRMFFIDVRRQGSRRFPGFSRQLVADLGRFLGLGAELDPALWTTRDGQNFETTPQQCAVMMEGLARWIIPLLKARSMQSAAAGVAGQGGAGRRVLRLMRRYGFYRRRGAAGQSALPGPIQAMNAHAGVVVLCAKPILEEVKQMSGQLSNYGGDLAADLFGSVLLHEHFHALVEEGRDPTRGERPTDPVALQQALVLEESLAEWTELDFHRGNDVLRDWVIAHALSGPFPSWPYAGAMLLEERTRKKKNPRREIRRLIHDYRKAAAAAAQKFLTQTR